MISWGGIEAREAFRIEEAVDLNDLLARNCKPHDREGPPVGYDDHSGGAIDRHLHCRRMHVT